jgi:hypothetical protein
VGECCFCFLLLLLLAFVAFPSVHFCSSGSFRFFSKIPTASNRTSFKSVHDTANEIFRLAFNIYCAVLTMIFFKFKI